MDWLVFGDDWGRHPSTTQHLIAHLPAGDRVIWVNSIGMRAPSLSRDDARRVVHKARAIWRPAPKPPGRPDVLVEILSLPLLPAHHLGAVRAANRRVLRRTLVPVLERHGFDRPAVLVTNPVVAHYLDVVPYRRALYLRLDAYADLPGVDAALATTSEAMMLRLADEVLATARALLPSDDAIYLPQGVDPSRFEAVPTTPPSHNPTLGFFGLFAAWVDVELIAAAARRHPAWRFEFLGPSPAWPSSFKSINNIVQRPAVSFDALPAAISHWRAAWIPFEVSPLTAAVNPLKAREYLAAGLPTFSTPMPEVAALAPRVTIGDDLDALSCFLDDALADSRRRRERRRESVGSDSWSARAQQLAAAAA